MRNYYVLFLLTFFILIHETAHAQPLVRNFSFHMQDVRIYNSIPLPNGDIVLFGKTSSDLNTHPVYSTNLSALKHFLACYSSRGELKWYTLITVKNLLETSEISADQNNNIYLGATFN